MTESPIPEQLRRLREALITITDGPAALTTVRTFDLAWALERLDEQTKALRRAERWFRDYERQHRLKGTMEGNLKADTNEERADFCAAAIADKLES